MEIQKEQTDKPAIDKGESGTFLSSAAKLTPLELNNIKLDIRHTVLTPDYLEGLMKNEGQNIEEH